jgi:hypothetical protein
LQRRNGVPPRGLRVIEFSSALALRLLQGLAVLLFVMAGLPVLFNRIPLRRAAVGVYLAALALAAALIVRWLVYS